MAQHFKDLVAWQKAMDMVTEIYKMTDGFPKREIYSLIDQIRRAAVSVPSNIAEGQAHHSHREFRHFLRHSAGSLAELETQLLLAERIGYADHLSTEGLLQRVHEVGRILNGLIGSLPELVCWILVTQYWYFLQCTWKNRSSTNMHAAPTKTNNAIITPGSWLTSGIKSEAAT
jgi:four helix bundle protein